MSTSSKANAKSGISAGKIRKDTGNLNVQEEERKSSKSASAVTGSGREARTKDRSHQRNGADPQKEASQPKAQKSSGNRLRTPSPGKKIDVETLGLPETPETVKKQKQGVKKHNDHEREKYLKGKQLKTQEPNAVSNQYGTYPKESMREFKANLELQRRNEEEEKALIRKMEKEQREEKEEAKRRKEEKERERTKALNEADEQVADARLRRAYTQPTKATLREKISVPNLKRGVKKSMTNLRSGGSSKAGGSMH